MVVKYVCDIPIIAYNINQSIKAVQRHPICLTDSDCDCIIHENVRRDKIEYEINISVEDFK